jgi:outer membrane protein assembly factor BamB
MRMRLLTLGIALGAAFALTAHAADWPQWRGPNRNGVSAETGLLKEWPKEGPKLLWTAKDLGEGYSTPAVAGGRVYLMSNTKGEEFVQALDAKDGKLIWSTAVGKVGPNRGPQYPGTRCTPTIDGDALYALGSDGDLVCLETAKGTPRWKKNLRTDFAGRTGNWAYAESPLIDGDVLVCTPGGSKAALAALNKKNGDVIWKTELAQAEDAAYASAMVVEADKVKQYVQFLGKGLIGVDARTGKMLWRYAKTSGITNITTPLCADGTVFSTNGGGRGATGGGALVKLSADKEGVKTTEVYFAREMATKIGGTVRVGDYLYGTNSSGLVCMEFATGKVKWQNKSVGTGAVCYADGHLYVRAEGPSRGGKSEVALVEATPEGYKEKGRFTQPDRQGNKPAWPYPVVANGCLYLRDQGVLLCYDVKGK